MPVYAIAQLTISDRDVYDSYVSRFMSVLNWYKGRVCGDRARQTQARDSHADQVSQRNG